MVLFVDHKRTDSSRSKYRETTFGFLDRVQSNYFGNVRELLNRWVEGYPTEHRAELIQRLRSASSDQQMSAFWELYLHEVMRSARWDMTVHPGIVGSSTFPDFLARRAPDLFFLEATSSTRSAERVADDNRLGIVIDELEKLETPNFSLWVDCDRSGADSPSVTAIRKDLSQWLRGLSRERALADYAAGGIFALPSHVWSHGGWEFSFIAYPRSEGAIGKPDLHTVGSHGRSEASIVDHTTPMQRAVQAKRVKYGRTLAHPLALGYLNTHEHSASPLSHHNALFGPLLGGPDGCWFTRRGPVNKEVAAIVAVWNLKPWTILRSVPTVFLNPWAQMPLAAELPWPVVHTDPSDGSTTVTEPALSLGELLDLPEDWPGSADLA